ncbi:glp-1/Notch intracellular domain [Caenorhabditis elegans]|uniref:Protein glp-1 n=7 Tax=Caenorhabditis elegans TaxID=6239 RepID=GLP1_CAEEL|nr:glp-1/Notch intracellular domain [Caenorhabditis elegans]P13508.1 RecName: Full=Protein glp-1; Contains: RecName: Full=glp-1/Notch intracellular domain; Flags: Precursor [Caenorhabditis elegans]AAA28058.1 glp-1 protein [Caenorhabditis elegans]CAA79620.1 glp-1/Notch intracellular domain [Caenorhabditis elegans]|eukprot:NP_499014.1 Protein glp-1 [Caenorhabditis elegans]
MRVLLILLAFFAPIASQLMGGECGREGACSVNGKCYNGKLIETYWCRCKKGFGGAFCERECDLDCKRGEKCIYDVYGENPTCICQDCEDETPPTERTQKGCEEGYGGPDCKTPLFSGVNPCDSDPCNNGLCYPFYGGFQCICNNGYGGSYCEEGIDHCAQNECAEGSTCVNSVYNYYCDCPIGKSGRYCERTECALMGNICNHGRCIPNRDEDKNFRCVCDSGYEGEFCNKDKNECLIEETCVNNSTCFNLHGDFTCTCKPGYAGKYCEEAIDMCKDYVCQNDGYCAHDSNQMPICYCEQGFTGQRCEIECPSGFGGIHCDLPLQRPHCSRSNGTCYNDGRCINGFCVCEPDYIGDRCEINRKDFKFPDIQSCKYNPCVNNATCIDLKNSGYSCHCPLGFYGLNCEQHLLCTPTTCANGGTCEGVNGVIRCNCPNGFSGDYCEIKDRQLCSRHPCKNGGVCKNTGYCECQYGYTGPTCEEVLVIEKSKETVIRDLCEQRKCMDLASNGICNPECNLEECNFDGGDCSGGQRPFSKCQYPARCADQFANGVCNQECNNEECLYDGLDCQSELFRCPAHIRKHCIERRGDGVCNLECSFIGCGFDGGDCNNGTEAIILSDIRIKVQIDPIEFQATGGETLMQISANLRATVRIQRDELGPLVFRWDGEHEMERVEMNSSKLEDQFVLSHHVRRYRQAVVTGIVLYLEVEEICKPEFCRFSTAQSVVDLIAAGLVKSDGRMSLGLPITEAMVAVPKRNEIDEGWSRSQVILFACIAFLAFGTVVAGVIAKNGPERSRKRKMVNATVWMPPMESTNEKGRRNQSNHSSQCSLLDNSAYYHPNTKRHCSDYSTGYNGEQYSQIYPQTLANGYPGDYNELNFDFQSETFAPADLPADEIPLHVQAAGPDAITAPITNESVNQVDSKYRRRVLHWLAANVRGKPEDVITTEAIRCLKAGADVNARDCDENTALMLAVRAHRVRLSVVLLREGANPTIFNNSERSALHEAVVNKDLRILRHLLTDKRLLKEIDELDRNGMTALMLVARELGKHQVEMAELLLSKGAKLDYDGAARKDSNKYKGRTALHYAAMHDNEEMVIMLVRRSSNKDKQDEDGRTPIMLAAKEGCEKTVQYLALNDASLGIVDSMDMTAAQVAEASYHHELAAFLRQVANERHRNDIMRQQIVKSGHGAKSGRQTVKNIKRAGSRKTPTSAASSRETNHLTPPPSDGSFSSPSPHYYPTTTSTPNRMETSPEYMFNHEMAPPVNAMWYTTPPPYQDPNYRHVPPNTAFQNAEQMNGSFYC